MLRRAFGRLARALTVAVSALAGVASLATPALAQTATEWPQFRGGPTLAGVSPAAVPAALKVRWTFEAGDAVESSAAIAGGVAYVGSQKGELVALDLATGKPRWRYKTTEGIGESSPAVSTTLGLVFVGDLGGTFHAVRIANGQAAWTFKTKGEIKSSAVLFADKVIIGSYDGSLYGLDARAGTKAWEVHTENYVHGTPAVIDGVAYLAGCDEVFRAVRVSDGKDLGTLPVGAYTGASVAAANGRAYFGTFDNEVLAVDLKTEKVVWRYSPKDRQFPFYSSAAIADGKVVLGGRDKRVHAIDAVSGKAAWTYATRARVESSPAIAGGRVFIGSSDGRFYVLDLKTGKPAWQYEAGSPITASPAVADGVVVVGTNDGTVIAFGA